MRKSTSPSFSYVMTKFTDSSLQATLQAVAHLQRIVMRLSAAARTQLPAHIHQLQQKIMQARSMSTWI